MLKVFFSDQGTKDQLDARITDIAVAALAELQRGTAFDDEYLATGGPFPDRLHLIVLVTDLYLRFLEATVEWARWAQDHVADWPSSSEGTDQRRALETRRARARTLLASLDELATTSLPSR